MRGTAMAELEAMTPRFSQWLPGEEIPEKHWMYRLAKKHWFGDFGAYQAEPPSAGEVAANQCCGAGSREKQLPTANPYIEIKHPLPTLTSGGPNRKGETPDKKGAPPGGGGNAGTGWTWCGGCWTGGGGRAGDADAALSSGRPPHSAIVR